MEEKIEPNKIGENWRDEDGKFKEGHPDFGAGRPLGSYSLVTILKKKLAETIKEKGKEAGEDLVDIWLGKARTEKGFEALKEMVHYTDGMPTQPIEHSGSIEQEIKVDEATNKIISDFIKWRKEA